MDRALRVTLPESFSEVAGAVLMDLLGPFEVEDGPVSGGAERYVTLVFFPTAGTAPDKEELLAALPPGSVDPEDVAVDMREVPRDWVEGWRDHFRPVEIGRVRVRPPWEPAAGGGDGGAVTRDAASRRATSVDVVINPGLGFGTGLHPTTRGTLELLQIENPHGPVVDAGTGSGILAIAAAKLGWHPIEAFDNDPLALLSARENVEANGVQHIVRIHETDLDGAPGAWFAGATVLANMTLEPVVALVRKLNGGEGAPDASAAAAGAKGPAAMAGRAAATDPPRRVVVSGILAGAQECELLGVARDCGFAPGRRLYEAEWVSLEFLPAASRGKRTGRPSTGASRG
ncbi:MAG: 50S ribosomal protein L11 methyltransferase [Thermoleophilia bacterium]|nr:50S ribosomal protein L11 methyltransferase [Thermoleophilia bacterium]